MYQFILLIHVFAAVCVVALVLVQQGKGATMGAAFGSGASQTVFGSRGSGSFLFKVTITFAAIFFITSITLNYLAMHAYRQTAVVTLPALPLKPASAHAPLPSSTQPIVPAESEKTDATTASGQTMPNNIPERQ